ncbi:MAG TPA: DUF1648 domain-containing protein [Pyrinomonadaceae bacterium]
MSDAASRRLRHYTNIPFETFIALFTLLPFFALAYSYSYLPERVPLFLNLGGEVEVWGKKSLLSVFRVPLMAVITQAICLLMKYGAVQSASLDLKAERAQLEEQYLHLEVGLWDWLRFAGATKMSAASLDTIFLSLPRFKFLSRPTFVITAVAALLGVAGALYYGYRLFVVRREMKARFVAKAGKTVDKQHVYGGLMYFNPSDSALFVNKYIFNFANKWVWVFIASIIAYPLLVFLPS